MNYRKTLFTLTIAMMLPICGLEAQTVTSPDGNVAVKFSLSQDGVPTYEMTYKKREVIRPSHLG